MNEQITSDDNFLEQALSFYCCKESATKSIFLADLRLILNFEQYFIKNYEKNPILVHNQLNIITNLFGRRGMRLLDYKINNSQIKMFLKDVQNT